MNKDTIQILQDSLRHLNQNLITNQSGELTSADYFNYVVGFIGLISAIITIYVFRQSYKTKKLQDFVYKQAQIALDKESAQEKLNKTKEELTNVETRLNELQKQIQKDLPIEARKAVLKDRLEESIENMKKYYDDVVTTKEKLSILGENNSISSELLKSIQQEIEPKYLIKEKINNLKTYITIVSTLAGVIFAIVPYPVGNYIGGTLLLISFPIALQLIKLTIVVKSKDKQSTNSILRFWISLVGTVVTLFSGVFFWLIAFSEMKYRNTFDIRFIAFVLNILTLIMLILTYKTYKKYKTLTR